MKERKAGRQERKKRSKEGLKISFQHKLVSFSVYIVKNTFLILPPFLLYIHTNAILTGNAKHFVNRICSLTKQDTGCVRSSSSADTYQCYCNKDKCDSLASNPNICNSAHGSLASLALVFSALLLPFLIDWCSCYLYIEVLFFFL